ncbi:MAG: hypothetical protein K8H74_11945 [Notoacmeibacter sp.]|nr:hypothetical protein [Notoacmeibacter sp.]
MRPILPAAIIAGLAAAALATHFPVSQDHTVQIYRYGLSQSTSAACDIKGNISINSGERIYHVPGQKYYNSTVIRPEYGERWFCSEAEARAAGWRKARR